MRFSPLYTLHDIALVAATLALLGLVPALLAVQITVPFLVWFALLRHVVPPVRARLRRREPSAE